MGRSLVTGATGCIGLSLVRKLLLLRTPVTVLVRNEQKFRTTIGHISPSSNLNIVEAEILDTLALERASEHVEVVYHAAAKVHSLPATADEEKQFFAINVDATDSLLQACRMSSKLRSFVFFSTIAVHGSRVRGPIDENTVCNPDTAYAKSKLQAERLVKDFSSKTGISSTILRLAMVYGEGDRGNFNKLVKAINKERFLLVDGGRALKSLTYSETVAAIALRAASRKTSSSSEVFVVADPQPYSLRVIAETISGQLGKPLSKVSIPGSIMRTAGFAAQFGAQLLGIKPPLTVADVDKLSTDSICDVAKLSRVLGFPSIISLEEGLRRTLRVNISSKSRLTRLKTVD